MKIIWSQVKQWVASRNVTFKTEDIKLLCEQRFDEMREEWCPVCDHAKRTEKGYLEKEEIITDFEAHTLIISFGGNASDSSDK
jgi:hypothetical protein